jgi:hypothetical protein
MSEIPRHALIGSAFCGPAPCASLDADEDLLRLLADLRALQSHAAQLMDALEHRAGSHWSHIETLDREQDRLCDAIVNHPAASFRGVAHKLALWRSEAARAFPDDFDHAHESFAFSAYQDILRLTGLGALSHPNDEATRARLRAYRRTTTF